MRHRNKKIKVMIAGLTLCVSLLCSGCSIGSRQIYFDSASGRQTIFKIAGKSCPQEEALVYLANYKNLYGKIYDTDLWGEEYDTDTMESSIKDAVLTHLTKVYALDVYAQDNDISLTDKELDKVNEAAKTYFESLSRAEKKYTGVSKKEITAMYENYALAEKVYAKLMNDVDENVSEDEARIMQANVIYLTDKDKAEEISAALKNGSSFDRLASSYSEADDIAVTFGRGSYESAIEDVVFSLDNEEISDMITASDGYYIFECVNKYDEELSEANKATIISNRQKAAMNAVIDSINSENYSDLNEKLWDKITIDKDSDISTNTFFSTLDEAISF